MSEIVNWFDSNFITIVNGLAFGFLLYMLSVGLSLILGAMNVLNLTHGVFYLIGAYTIVAVVDASTSWTLFMLAIGLAVVFGVASGGVLAVLTAPLVKRGHDSHTDQALLTLGLALCGGQLLLMEFGGDTRSVKAPPGLGGSVELIGHQYPTYRLFLIGVGVALVVVVTYIMERTPLGALVRATVADPEMTRALGIDTRKVIVGVLGLGSALAMVAGVLGGPYLGAYPGLDWQVLLIGLVVVVVGGMGSVKGAFVGALIIGQAQVLGTALVPSFAPFILLGAMAIVLVVRPSGLLGDVRLGR
jgi:branched-chain amino acid transport system permease protein